ncbi:MAG: 8-amino-7-oxononanoate synthase [Polyangiaceae bacterium]
MKQSALRHLKGELLELERATLRRFRPAPSDPTVVSFCSNDYLGLAAQALAIETLPGAGAARLIAGEQPEHQRLEQTMAHWLGFESALLFTSGYAANVGLLSSLARPGDLVVSDQRNHASIIDGIRLSKAEVAVVPHLDVEATSAALARHPTGRRWVITEGYFSMDADTPDLRTLRAICDAHDAALLVDDAHALGVLGPEGRGACAEQGVVPDALVGTFGKAFGAGGAFVAGSPSLIDWLWNRARSFVFSTGLSPLVAAAALHGVETARSNPALRAQTLAAAQSLRSYLGDLGMAVSGYGHILPVILGAPERAVDASRKLAAQGIHVQAIRPPTVAAGTSRLRITANARMGEADLANASGAFRKAFGA